VSLKRQGQDGFKRLTSAGAQRRGMVCANLHDGKLGLYRAVSRSPHRLRQRKKKNKAREKQTPGGAMEKTQLDFGGPGLRVQDK